MSLQINIFTDKRLNIIKFREGENGTSYYHKMCPWFLNDMESLLGGVTRMTVWIPSDDHPYNPYGGKSFYELTLFFDDFDETFAKNFGNSWIILHFDILTGEYMGNRVSVGRLRKGAPKLTIKERESLVNKIATERLKAFFDKGIQMGYLI